MRAIHVAAACILLAAATAGSADEPWDLWEERMTGHEPLRMVFVGRFPSPQACNAKALELSSAAPAAGITRLGYMCLPPEAQSAPRRDPTPSGR
ncbi:MAG TPA: hypothetical protein VMC04_19840 [Verrucomicrobiae bacterium]|jgi:hypothetical protein|nr:hypothetical protein [Verrucomicrobiae bacterium]